MWCISVQLRSMKNERVPEIIILLIMHEGLQQKLCYKVLQQELTKMKKWYINRVVHWNTENRINLQKCIYVMIAENNFKRISLQFATY